MMTTWLWYSILSALGQSSWDREVFLCDGELECYHQLTGLIQNHSTKGKFNDLNKQKQ